MHVTLAMSVTAAGSFLRPMIMFKGKPNGRIQREFSSYPEDCLYMVQENAWMDEHIMRDWVHCVLKPYVEMAPEHVIPLLFLDSYCCHMMPSVVRKIEELGVEVQRIPAGCTSHCQLVDVGINKPFKNHMRHVWEAWIVSSGYLVTHKVPKQEQVVDWIINAISLISEWIVKNSWLHGEFSYFKK